MTYTLKNTSIALLLTLVWIFTIPIISAQNTTTVDDLKGEWEILPEESEFSFKITTIWVFPVKGSMGGLSGNINFNKKNTDEFVDLTLKPATLNTGNDKRDEHLRSEDFFYVSEYPLIHFKGKTLNLEDLSNQKYTVEGKLTIRGVSHEETIPITFEGFSDPSKTRIQFTGSVQIDRNKYNVDFTGRIIEDKAKISYTITAQKK